MMALIGFFFYLTYVHQSCLNRAESPLLAHLNIVVVDFFLFFKCKYFYVHLLCSDISYFTYLSILYGEIRANYGVKFRVFSIRNEFISIHLFCDEFWTLELLVKWLRTLWVMSTVGNIEKKKKPGKSPQRFLLSLSILIAFPLKNYLTRHLLGSLKRQASLRFHFQGISWEIVFILCHTKE